jgi:hypothetical protein
MHPICVKIQLLIAHLRHPTWVIVPCRGVLLRKCPAIYRMYERLAKTEEGRIVGGVIL